MKFLPLSACLIAMVGHAFAQNSSPNTNLNARETAIVAAAQVGTAPQFQGARVIGIQPGLPLIYSLAVSGERPINFSVTRLPKGLKLDAKTGCITGALQRAGEYTFTARAKNSAGKAQVKIKIVCGDTLALTPPMGWNSYDTFGDSVTEAEMRTNINWFKAQLQPFGWEYVVADYRWYDPGAHDNNSNARDGAKLVTDEFGRLLPAVNRFPSATNGAGFKALADYAHSLGLKFGIHVMRGIPRQSVRANTPIEGSPFHAAEAANTNSKCPWCPDMFGVDATTPAGQAWYDSILRLYASWQVDFIKVDDLSSRPYSNKEVEAVRLAIQRCGRAIVFSTSPGETPLNEAAHVQTYANMWRISDDFWDNWKSMDHNFDLLAAWQTHGVPGHWPDADMIPLGKIGKRSVGKYRNSGLTRDEQLTLMSFWAIAPSPLMLGMNLPENDAWTTALLTSPEVLAVDQDALGKKGIRVLRTNGLEVWRKPLADGAQAVAIFNRGNLTDIAANRAIYQSPLLTRATPGTVSVDVALNGARKLYLVVDDGGDGFDCDHADWLEPKLISPTGERNLTSLKWQAATSGWQEPLVNKSVSGGALTVAGTIWTNGVGTHAASIIEYNLPAGCTRFQAQVGLDDAGTRQSSPGATVKFLVFTHDPRPTTEPQVATLQFSQLGLAGVRSVRDLWLRKNLPDAENFTAEIPAHGCVLLRVK